MKITLGTTYYNNPENIIPFIEHHLEYVDELIVVDDGSSDPYHILKYVQPSEKIKLYRVKHDYGFNSHGCRNLIMREAENEFVILMDSDIKIHDPLYAIDAIKNIQLKKDRLYRFITQLYDLGHFPAAALNQFLISKEHFFSVGGYDEELIGHRTGDDIFTRQLMNFGDEEILYEINLIILRPGASYLPDRRFKSEKDIYDPDRFKMVKERIRIPDPNKKILTFEWEKL